MHNDYLKPWQEDAPELKPSYSEWDIRTAWDNSIAGNTTKGSPSFAFDSYAFRAFLEELKMVKELVK